MGPIWKIPHPLYRQFCEAPPRLGLSEAVPRTAATGKQEGHDMDIILWIIAAVLVIAGILALFRRQILWGIVLIVVGLLVGPGGVSLFT